LHGLHRQVAALEDISSEESVITLDGRPAPADVAAEAERRMSELWPDRPKRWWESVAHSNSLLAVLLPTR
jgi:hypothetical protein